MADAYNPHLFIFLNGYFRPKSKYVKGGAQPHFRLYPLPFTLFLKGAPQAEHREEDAEDRVKPSASSVQTKNVAPADFPAPSPPHGWHLGLQKCRLLRRLMKYYALDATRRRYLLLITPKRDIGFFTL